MKILVFSPIELPFTIGARYCGLEKLAVQHAEQWALRGHDVTLLAHKDTDVPEGIKLLPCEGYVDGDRSIHAEQKAYTKYQTAFKSYDVIYDIGHLHLVARYLEHLPTANVLNHAPIHWKYPKASHNIISWSKWGVRAFRKIYGQESRYQETIMVDPEVFKPTGKRTDRFLTIGRMSKEKGNLNAVRLCKKLGLKLDVCGGRGSEITSGAELTKYELAVMSECDGKDIVFIGEVAENEKIELMQTCRGLLYITDHTEITSHKVQECMLCGVPVIVPDLGGIPEIVTHCIDGFLCSTERDYEDAIKNLDRLVPAKTREQVALKYSPAVVTDGYLKLLEEVANGARW